MTIEAWVISVGSCDKRKKRNRVYVFFQHGQDTSGVTDSLLAIVMLHFTKKTLIEYVIPVEAVMNAGKL
jgi:hypothetical protein